MQNKMINFMFTAIFCYILFICGGCGSGGSSFTQADSTQATFATNDQTINEDMQPINTIGDINIQMINTGKNTLNIQLIAMDNNVDLIEPGSSCINKNLAPSEQCTITINIKGVYTSSTNVNLLIDTSNKQLKQSIRVFNYNYTHNLPDAQKIQVDALTDNLHRYDSYDKTYSITGKANENIITITNKELSPLAIENIIFEPESIIAYPNNVVNKIIPEKSSCVIGAKLLPNQSCDIVIFNTALSSGVNDYFDKLKFKFVGIDTLNVIWIFETIYLSQAFSMVNCNKINDCPVKFDASGYKATLDHLTIMYHPIGTIVDTNASEYPCIPGADFTNIGYCNLNVSIESNANVSDNELWLDFYVRVYVDDNNYILMYSSNPKGILDLRDYDIQRPEVEYNFFLNPGMATSYIDENKAFVPIGNWITIRHQAITYGGFPIEIKAVRAIPSITNFMNVDKGQLISSESMIYSNTCLGKNLTPQSDSCDLKILAGQNGYGSAGTLEIDYSIDGGATQTMSTTLPDIAQAKLDISVNNPDPSNPNMVTVWKTGDTIQPIYVNTSKTSAGFTIDNGNTNQTGTYVLIEYDGTYKPILPNCLAWVNAVNGYMYNNYYFCAYEFDFSKKNVGDIVKTKLIMGNHKETVLEVNFTITD